MRYLLANLCLFAVPVAAQVPGLVGHWPFESTALDASGRGHHGALTNVVYGPGRIGAGAVCAGGAGGGIFVPGADFDLAGNFTFSVHAKADALNPTTGRVLAQRYLTGMDQLWYFAMFSNKLRLTIYNDAFSRLDYDVPFAFSTNTWYHAGFTVSTNKLSLYVDGALIGDPATYTGMIRRSASVAMSLGYSTSPDWVFSGTLDDGRFYNYALSGREVRQVMLGMQPGEGPR